MTEFMGDFERAVERIHLQNQIYLGRFKEDLKKEGLAEKTIKRHIANVEFYINEFLCNYEPHTMEHGCYELNAFLGDWFIHKSAWASCENIKTNCASIKKFYKFMLDLNYIKKEDYDSLEHIIKEGKESWLERMRDFEKAAIDETF